MPFTAVNLDVRLNHAPHPERKCWIHVAANFDASAPFMLCIFLHGHALPGVPFDKHIEAATGQMASSPLNVILVAPRFGDDDAPGSFAATAGFSAFIDELRTGLPPLLTKAGLADADAARVASYAAAKAPIVLVAFSGGWAPLGGILKGLLALDPQSDTGKATHCADRVVGIELLDSIYGPISSAGVIAWQQQRRQQSALVSIYGRDTGDNARAANIALIAQLKKMDPVRVLPDWTKLVACPPRTVAFFEVTTGHLSIPNQGPPQNPIVAFLSLLRDRLVSSPSV